MLRHVELIIKKFNLQNSDSSDKLLNFGNNLISGTELLQLESAKIQNNFGRNEILYNSLDCRNVPSHKQTYVSFDLKNMTQKLSPVGSKDLYQMNKDFQN